MPKFYTKKGWLTPYAMACGYIHNQNNRDLQLSMQSSGTFEIYVSHDYQEKLNDPDDQHGNGAYRYFESLTEARKEFKRLAVRLAYHFEKNADMMVID